MTGLQSAINSLFCVRFFLASLLDKLALFAGCLYHVRKRQAERGVGPGSPKCDHRPELGRPSGSTTFQASRRARLVGSTPLGLPSAGLQTLHRSSELIGNDCAGSDVKHAILVICSTIWGRCAGLLRIPLGCLVGSVRDIVDRDVHHVFITTARGFLNENFQAQMWLRVVDSCMKCECRFEADEVAHPTESRQGGGCSPPRRETRVPSSGQA